MRSPPRSAASNRAPRGSGLGVVCGPVGTLYRMGSCEMACWVCDYADCGHVWLAVGETLPEKCAKCRRRGWNSPGLVAPVERQPARKPSRRPELHPEEASPEPARLDLSGLAAFPASSLRDDHDPKTCRVYRCGQCKAAGKGQK